MTTTLTKERIGSLRKQMIRKEFKQKGIDIGVHEFKLKLKNPLSSYLSYEPSNHLNSWFYGGTMLEELIELVTRQIRKKIAGMTEWLEVKEFIDSLSFGQYQVEGESLFEMIHQNKVVKQAYTKFRIMDEKQKQEISKEKQQELEQLYQEAVEKEVVLERNIELLARVVNLKYRNHVERQQLMEDNMPIKLSVVRKIKRNHEIEETPTTMYGIAKGAKVSKKRHNQELYFPKYGRSSTCLVVDLPIILAEAFVINTLEQFILKNTDHYRFALMQTLFIQCFNPLTKELWIPYKDEIFFKDLKQAFEEAGLMEDAVVIRDLGGSHRSMKEAFYLRKDEKGQIDHLKNSFVLFSAIPELLRQVGQIENKTDRLLQQRSDYAKSFQTKKHINKQTLEIMNNNKFLQFYGYVELDNEVDLKLFHQLEKELMEFQKFVPMIRMADHSFRVKKLGHHKAAGLYYSEPNCSTIIDIHTPSSFAHEWAHQIDFTFLGENRMLSEDFRFRRLAEKYEKEVNRLVNELPDVDPFKQKWNGKTKYNSTYFLLPTEIFARSFELYLYHHKGLRSSFIKPTYDDVMYPSDSGYLKEVARYFDQLMSKLLVRREAEVCNIDLSKDTTTVSNQTTAVSMVVAESVSMPTIKASEDKYISDSTEGNKFVQMSLF